MRVFEVMTTKVTVVSPDTSFPEVWQIIFKKRIHGLPVVDKENKLLGIIAEENLLSRLYSSRRFNFLFAQSIIDFFSGARFEKMEKRLKKLASLRAKEVMSEAVVTTTAEAPILRALASMMTRRVRQLPVVTKKREVIGMITKGDIFDALFKKYLNLPQLGSFRKKKVLKK